ncbi:MAG: YqgE/AlgH family protein [Bacteroidales bacterium]
MATQTLKPCAGRLLISEPSLQDFYFRKAVVLLADHGEEGSFGLIINKPIHVKLNEVAKDFPDFNATVFLGGPVKTDSIFFIHTRNDLIKDSLKVLPGIYWGGNIERVTELMVKHEISAREIRFFVGYSGWAPKQLDEEMERNSWIVSKTFKDQVISDNPENLWSEILRSLGGQYQLWSNFPNDPSLN